MYFKSRKDVRSTFIFWSPILVVILLYIVLKPSILLYIISGLMICLLLWVWFGTGYKLKEELIKIKSGPFRTTIKIKDIKKVRSVTNDSITMSYLSGPALSVDQLEITYGETFDIVNISPDYTSNFLKILLDKNPNIEVDEILKLIQYSNAIGKGPNFVN